MSRLCLPLLLVATLGLFACAQTGQQLTLDPQPRSEGEALGEGRTVVVSGADARENPRLGVLENRRREDAELTTEQDLGELVASRARRMLEDRGFRTGGNHRRSLDVVVEDIEHRVSSDLPRRVETRVVLRFEAANGDRRLTGRNRHTRRDQVSGRPDPEENAAYIDAAVAGGLERLITEELLRFLAAQ